MNRQIQLSFLEAELSRLDARLDILRSTSLERIGLQHRRNEVAAELDVARAQLEDRGMVDLTFRGQPVDGTRAVQAGFAAKALEAFEKAVATFSGSLMQGGLSPMGPIPRRDEHMLFVTALARGSFGFHLEERVPATTASPLAGPSYVSRALDIVQELLDAGVDDESIADVTVGTDLRALNALRAFVEVLAQHNATCSVTTHARRFSFTDAEHVRHVLALLATENITREAHEFVGRLFVLPNSRQFELSLTDGGVIRGRVDDQVSSEQLLLSHTNVVRVKGSVTSVGRQGRVRRLLLESIERVSDS